MSAHLVGRIPPEVLGFVFFACLVLITGMVLTQGLRIRPAGTEMALAAGIIAVYVLLGVRMAVPERSHLMEYGVLAVLLYEAINEGLTQGRRISCPAWWAFLIASLIGAVDELLQLLLPARVFDWRDIAFNVLAAFTAVIGMVTLRWARRSRIRNPSVVIASESGEDVAWPENRREKS